MLKKIALGLALLIAGILLYAATLPDTVKFQRSASIKAAPETIFPLIADLKAWRGWSPYETKDPAMKRTYEGAESGKGAAYAWDGNSEVGAGRMEILAAEPRDITIRLDFLKPFETHNTARFTLAPKGDATDVTWSMEGPCPYVARVISLFVDMDRMIGRDFEAGLAQLKAKAEAS